MESDPRKLLMRISLAASVVMLVGKTLAYAITGSYAILADAAESVVHGVATSFAAFSLWYAAKPPDSRHTYGHGRIAYVSNGLEGALVFSAAVAVISSGVYGLVRGTAPRDLGVGIGISAGLMLINFVLGASLIHVGRRHRALVLVSNGWHVLSDAFTTLAAVAGLALVMATGLNWLDPAAALLIGGYIMKGAVEMIYQAYAGLMDEVPGEVSERLVATLKGEVERGQIAGFHQLRCRRANDELWVELHVLVDGDLTVAQAHEQVTHVERALASAFKPEKVNVTSHIEPDDHQRAHPMGHRLVSPLASDP